MFLEKVKVHVYRRRPFNAPLQGRGHMRFPEMLPIQFGYLKGRYLKCQTCSSRSESNFCPTRSSVSPIVQSGHFAS